MKRWLWALLLATQAAASDPYPRIACLAVSGSGGTPIMLSDSGLNVIGAKHLARFQMIALTGTPFSDKLINRVDSLRAMRPAGLPKLKVLCYLSWGQSFQFATLNTVYKGLYDVAANYPGGNGLLKDTGGNGYVYAANPWINFGLTPLMQQTDSVLAYYVQSSGNFDGLWLDTVVGALNGGLSDNSLGVDYTTAGFASAALLDTARCRNLLASRNRIRDMGRIGSIMVVNGYMPDTNQTRSTWPSGTVWENWGNVAALLPMDNGINQVAHSGPYAWIKEENANYSTNADYGTSTRYNATSYAEMRSALAAGCMTGAYTTYGASDWATPFSGVYSTNDWWYDEYSVNPATGASDSTGQFVGWLGQPKAPAQRDLTTGVWYREFEHGLVLLNSTGSSATVPFGRITHRRWRRINGSGNAATNSGKDEACPTLAGTSGGTGGALFLVEVSPGQ